MKCRQFILVAVTIFFMSSAQAELYLEAGFEGGGDDLAETTNGESISVGGGLKLAVGLQHAIGDGSSAVRVVAGYMFDSIEASDGEADISTITLDAMYIISSELHSFGIGGTMHMGPEYTEDSVFGDFEVEFDDAFGFVLQYGFHFSPGFEIGARYTDITYEKFGIELDASSFGLYMSNGF